MTLVTLTDYKRAIGETNAANDTFHQDALDAATSAVLNYTDRDFGTALAVGNKSYWYNGSGILDIDDADTVNTVTFQNSTALPGEAWIAKTEGPPTVVVYTYLELPVIDWGARSVESFAVMGFTRNLDQWLTRNPTTREINTTVNANFGWPTVPKDVQRATIWTARDFEEISPTGGEGGDLASESIAEVSRAWFSAQSQAPSEEAIPSRARGLLDVYRRRSL